MDLTKGHKIQTKNFKTVTVDVKLGEGGQGAVYRVDYDGKPKALKWYTGKKFKDADKFYKNLEENIKKGKPSKAFLWPEDITEKQGEAFGYIMDLRPAAYKDFSQFLIGKEGFASVTAMVNAALHITAGFRALHNKGYSYQDLNDGNFFINPKDGDVLVCDNDNVSEHGKDSGIAGKPRYMAPEIVTGKEKPSMQTDKYSLSVILFLLWVKNHPLEGKDAYPVAMTAEHEQRIYGKNPVFVCDPHDRSNCPVQGLNKGAIYMWPQLPKYLQETFIKAFSNKALHDPSERIIEKEWLRLFIRMRAEIYKCSCGKVYLADPVDHNPCPSCQKKNVFAMCIKTNKYTLATHQRTKLYACHTESDSEDFETLTGEVVLNGNDYELKNMSGKNWTVTDAGTTINVTPNGSIKMKKGLSINFGNAKAEII